jgi:Phage gp6-like head-tail connector protein
MAAGDLTTLSDVKAWLNTSGSFGTTDDAILTRLITAASSFLKRYLGRDVTLSNYTELRDGLGGAQPASFVFANFPVQQVYQVAVAGVAIPPLLQQSGTLITSGATAAGNPTLNFTAVPSWVVAGMALTDPTTPGAVQTGTIVQSTTPTTIVMNQNAAGSGVGAGDLIVLGPTPGSSVAVQPSSFYPPFGYLFTPTKLVISGFYVPRQPLCVSLIYQAGFATVPYEIAQACLELVAKRYRMDRQHPGVVADHIGTAAGDGVTYSQKDLDPWVARALQQFRAVAPVSAMPRGY